MYMYMYFCHCWMVHVQFCRHEDRLLHVTLKNTMLNNIFFIVLKIKYKKFQLLIFGVFLLSIWLTWCMED